MVITLTGKREKLGSIPTKVKELERSNQNRTVWGLSAERLHYPPPPNPRSLIPKYVLHVIIIYNECINEYFSLICPSYIFCPPPLISTSFAVSTITVIIRSSIFYVLT